MKLQFFSIRVHGSPEI